MIQIIIAQFIWILSASIEGIVQGYYYDLYPFTKGHKNIHYLYVIKRTLLLFSLLFFLSGYIDSVQCFIFSVASAFNFSFFHNGFYYITRNNLNEKIYKKRFFDDSDSSQALMNINIKFRTGMLIIGLITIARLILDIL